MGKTKTEEGFDRLQQKEKKGIMLREHIFLFGFAGMSNLISEKVNGKFIVLRILNCG